MDDEDIANMTQEEKDALVDAIMQEVLLQKVIQKIYIIKKFL
jgi:hypothetical protein